MLTNSDEPTFAKDSATAAYYERRASEYDDWYLGEGRFAARARPAWQEEVDRLLELVRSLHPARTLDVACGSGFLTRHLRGRVVGVDQSPSMVAQTRSRLLETPSADATALVGDALALPFADSTFDRVFTGHFYGHLPADEREAFLAEARRVAPELVVIDSALRPGVAAEQWQERTLGDGSRHRVYKRYLSADQLVAELGGEVLLDGSWFVAVHAHHPGSTTNR